MFENNWEFCNPDSVLRISNYSEIAWVMVVIKQYDFMLEFKVSVCFVVEWYYSGSDAPVTAVHVRPSH